MARQSRPTSRLPLHRRIRSDRRAVLRWMTAVAVAAATALTTSGLLSDASRARAEWKPTVDVMVTTHQISAGNDLADVTALERWPAALAPRGALAEIPARARARIDLAQGTPLTAELVTTDSGTRGRVVLALPADVVSPPLDAGDRVDLWDTSGVPARLVASDALVARHRGGAVAVAVTMAEQRATAGAVGAGSLVVSLIESD